MSPVLLLSATAAAAAPLPEPVACYRAAPAQPQCEIVVTAERRLVELSEVPLSLGLIDGSDIASQRLQSVRDLDARVPNLSVQPGVVNGAAALFGIRGVVTTGDETLGFDNPIGVYLDGVPLPRPVGVTLELAGIERVEVLRGPQGTLFGRNTTGGAISLVSAPPRSVASADYAIEIGSRNWLEQRLRLESGAIAPGLNLSFGALHRMRDGFVADPTKRRGRREPGGGEDLALRLSAAIDLGVGWRLTASGDWARLAGTPAASQPAQAGDGVALAPFVVDGRAVTPVQPAPVARWLAAATPLDPRCPARLGIARATRLCLPDAGVSTDRLGGGSIRLEGAIGTLPFRAITGYRGWRNRLDTADIDGVAGLAGFALTPETLLAGIPAATLLLIPGVTPAEAAQLAATPVPRTTAPIFATGNRRGTDQWSQEIELRSADGATVDWLVGAIAIDERGHERSRQRIGLVLDVESLLARRFGALAPALAAALPAGSRDRLFVQPEAILSYHVRNRSYAIFGQMDGSLAADLGFSLGLRLTHDRRRFRRDQNGPQPFSAAEQAPNRRAIAFTRPTGHVALDWRPADDLLVWTRLARGYLAGGWNARQPTRLATPTQTAVELTPFRPETIWASELGWRWSRPGVRLSGALFVSRRRDSLVNLPIPDAPTFGTIIVNAGRVDHRGAELEADVQLAPWLRVEGAAGYTDTDYRRFTGRADDGAAIDIATLVRPANMPRWTGSLSAIVTAPVRGTDGLEARLSWTGRGRRNLFLDPVSQPFRQQARAMSLLDATVRLSGVSLLGLHGDLSLWAENIGKPQAVRGVDLAQLGVATLIYSEPARFGLGLTLRQGGR